jgi:hypothetical protein
VSFSASVKCVAGQITPFPIKCNVGQMSRRAFDWGSKVHSRRLVVALKGATVTKFEIHVSMVCIFSEIMLN